MSYSGMMQQDEIGELINALKKFTPIIPDEVTKYLLQTSGCNIEDEESLRLVSLATQRYITEIVSKAKDYSITRQDRNRKGSDDKNDGDVLLLADLQNALHDKGINMNKKGMYN